MSYKKPYKILDTVIGTYMFIGPCVQNVELKAALIYWPNTKEFTWCNDKDFEYMYHKNEPDENALYSSKLLDLNNILEEIKISDNDRIKYIMGELGLTPRFWTDIKTPLKGKQRDY